MIKKLAEDADGYRRPQTYFPSARLAFGSFLAALRFNADDIVLLPAYVGWSPNEGSGVFDPIRELNIRYNFYRLDERLHVDIGDFRKLLNAGHVKAVVLIHYFGYPDPNLAEIATLAREYGTVIIEDEAHAMYTDLVGGASGNVGDACLFSLHKMLPVTSGGVLRVRPEFESIINITRQHRNEAQVPWDYDLQAIATHRRRNAIHLSELLKPLEGHVDMLWATLPTGVVPQTLPVLIRKVSRDDLYFSLNKNGIGAVSLYHTLIDEISEEEYPTSHLISRTILNLPVHQEVQTEDLDAMATRLRELTCKGSR